MQIHIRYSIIFVFALFLLSVNARSDDYDTEADTLLSKIDDKANPVLPSLEKLDQNARQEVFRNVANEADDCIAFYYSVGFCISRTNNEPTPGYDVDKGVDILQKLKHDKEAMYLVAVATTKAGGLDKKTIQTNVSSDISTNAMRIHNDCGNMSLITANSKTLRCKQLANNPSERLRYWLHFANAK